MGICEGKIDFMQQELVFSGFLFFSPLKNQFLVEMTLSIKTRLSFKLQY